MLAAALTGCVSYEPAPLSPEQSAWEVNSRSLDDPGFRAFLNEEKAGEGPWNVNRLALAAAYFHPDVAIVRAQAAEMAAAVETAGQRPNPVFTFGPQFASNRATYTPWFLAGNVAIPIETAGKRKRRIEQAVSTAEAARWRVSSQAWSARARVRTAMLDLYSARENLRLLGIERGLNEETIGKLTAQMEAGDVSPFELTQARLALNRTHLTWQDAKRNEVTGEAKLAAAVGVPVSAIRSVPLDLSDFQRLPEIGKTVSYRMALTQRADLMALLADYAAAEAALRLEIARQYPDFNLKPGYDYNSGQNRWQLGWSIELPLNGNRGPIAEAEARRQSAATAFLARQAAIQGELEIALADYNASRAKALTAEQLSREAKTAAETTRRLVDAGEVSALEHTRRQIEASAAEVALLAARLEAQVAAGSLENAMQSVLP
ncbi:MAG: TolC family protein [Verrucomicrobiae bacterium]|nr:TolC family protein [Verrucomicrobiae bacterium]